jgi:2-octaprenyl-6-methoxyphenol hydroxylase
MTSTDFDVLIVGGGLVGLSLAKGLEDLNFSYRLLDESLDMKTTQELPRALALSKTSLAILNHLGVYAELAKKMCSITQIEVSCERELGQLMLEHASHDFLGKVINLYDLHQVLHHGIQDQSSLINGRFKAYSVDSQTATVMVNNQEKHWRPKIIIAADGAMSSVRQFTSLPVERSSEQMGILSLIHLETPHLGHAYERFTHWGPMALLPWQTKEMVLVWAVSQQAIQEHQLQDKSVLLSAIQSQLGTKIGQISRVESIKVYPLPQVFMPKQSFHNILFLGNAAHTLHPVAGQGFNLSLRDIAVLLDTLTRFDLSADSFPMYLAQRHQDQRLTQMVTQFLASGITPMTHKIPGVCGMGMGLLNQIPSFKKLLAFYAQGLAYPLPNWVYQNLEVL